MTDSEFRRDYKVHVYETGFDGLLQPHSLFNYFQDIASAHAEKLGFGRHHLLKMNRFWVLSRMEVRIRKWPAWEDVVTISTWPRGTDKLFAVRDFKVTFADGAEAAAATSSWLIVDSVTKRIRKPHEELTIYNNDRAETSATGGFALKIETFESALPGMPAFSVRPSDTDVNLHTNNTSYIRWITDTYTPEFRTEKIPLKIEVNYIAETGFGDEIIISAAVSEENIYCHSVRNPDGNKEFCRVRILWGNRSH